MINTFVYMFIISLSSDIPTRVQVYFRAIILKYMLLFLKAELDNILKWAPCREKEVMKMEAKKERDINSAH